MGKGSLFIVAAPSGAGKTSLVKALIEKMDKICVSVSHTTRAMRPGEIHGKDYNFVSASEFDTMVTNDAFLEYATVFGRSYGTSKAWVSDQLARGIDVVLEIDWQGARQVRKKINSCVGIFIFPPSNETLVQRLRGRGQDDDATITSRMAEAKKEMSHFREFDYLVVNEDFNRALAELMAIVQGQRCSLPMQEQKLTDLIEELLGDEVFDDARS